MDAEAVLKHRVSNEQTSGEKKSPSKGVLIYYFFPAHMQIFRPIGHTFGSRRERVKILKLRPQFRGMEWIPQFSKCDQFRHRERINAKCLALVNEFLSLVNVNNCATESGLTPSAWHW